MNIVRTGVRSVWKRSWTFLGVKLQRFGSKRVKREVFKVTRREFTTLSGLQHMELFIGEFFLLSLCYCITIDFYSTTSTTVGFTA